MNKEDNKKIIYARFNKARIALIFWTLFIGIGAVAGAIGMLVQPDGSALGMDAMLPYFQVLPYAEILFQNFIFAGISLLIVNGLTNLTAAVFLFCRKKVGAVLGAVFGFTLMLWIIIQFIIFPTNFMSTIYFIFGACQLITGLCCYAFYNQAYFDFDESDYLNVGKNNNVLVVFYSRLNRAKKIAYEIADKEGAEVFGLETTENTAGTLGFWWSGRFAMHRWGMKLKEIPTNIQSYDKVIIVSPIWVFRICSPVREFLVNVSGKVKKADFYLVHFQKAKYLKAFNEMEDLLKIKADKRVSITSEFGKVKSRIEL